MSDDYSHLADAARAIVNRSDEERINFLSRWIWIYSEAAERVEAISRRMMSIRHPSQAPCLLVYGESGMGKTSMISYLKRYVFKQNNSIVHFDTRRCLTYKSFLVSFAEQLEIPKRANGQITSAELERELDRACMLRKMKVVVIDNLHDLMRGTRSDQRNVLAFLREMTTSNHPILLICFAIPNFEVALASDDQLKNRFVSYHLPLWQDDDEFSSFLEAIQSQLPLKRPSNLHGRQCIDYLLKFSGGNTKKIIESIKHASIAAITTGQERVTADLLRKWGGKPFQQEDWVIGDK